MPSINIELHMDEHDGTIRVTSVLRGGQLSRLVHPDDCLLSIDETDTHGLSIADCQKLFVGPLGTEVTLLFSRPVNGAFTGHSFAVVASRTNSEMQDIQAGVLRLVMAHLTDPDVDKRGVPEAKSKDQLLWIITLRQIVYIKGLARQSAEEVPELKKKIEEKDAEFLHQEMLTLQAENKVEEKEQAMKELISQQREMNEELSRNEKKIISDFTKQLAELKKELETQMKEKEVFQQLVKQREAEMQELRSTISGMDKDQGELGKELNMFQNLVKQREQELQDSSRALKNMEDRIFKSEELARQRQDEVHRVVEENIKLQAEAVAAVTVTADVHSDILHNRDERWRLRKNFNESATRALGVRTSRLEVVGIRPGPDPNQIEIDAHILPQTHATDEPPAITLAQELLTQISYPKSFLRVNSSIGQRLAHGSFRHEHEFVQFLRQTVLTLDHKIHDLREKLGQPQEPNGFAPNLIRALTPEGHRRSSQEFSKSPDPNKSLEYETRIERQLEKATLLENENNTLDKRVNMLEYENVKLLEENETLKKDNEKMELEVQRLRSIAFDSTAANDVLHANNLSTGGSDILA